MRSSSLLFVVVLVLVAVAIIFARERHRAYCEDVKSEGVGCGLWVNLE